MVLYLRHHRLLSKYLYAWIRLSPTVCQDFMRFGHWIDKFGWYTAKKEVEVDLEWRQWTAYVGKAGDKGENTAPCSPLKSLAFNIRVDMISIKYSLNSLLHPCLLGSSLLVLVSDPLLFPCCCFLIWGYLLPVRRKDRWQRGSLTWWVCRTVRTMNSLALLQRKEGTGEQYIMH